MKEFKLGCVNKKVDQKFEGENLGFEGTCLLLGRKNFEKKFVRRIKKNL